MSRPAWVVADITCAVVKGMRSYCLTDMDMGLMGADELGAATGLYFTWITSCIPNTQRGPWPRRSNVHQDEEKVENLIREFINQRVWAVVGASTDPSKYGNMIFRSLRSAGYTVYGVNPRGGQIEGQELYRGLADLPERPAVVDTVVPPHVTEQVVQQCAELGLTRVWMQPGSESPTAVEFCHEHDIQVVFGACAMIRRRTWN